MSASSLTPGNGKSRMKTAQVPEPPRGRAVRTVPVYEALAEDIKRLGVETVFGLIADDICQLIATLDSIGVHFFNARHETAAIMAASFSASLSRFFRSAGQPACASNLGLVVGNRSITTR